MYLSLYVFALSSIVRFSIASVECTFSAISSILPGNATLNFAYPVPQNGSFGSAGQPPGNLEFPTNATQLPALCAISVNVKTTETTAYNFGLFLPDTWNQRFVTGGNGGYGGGINWPDMGTFSQYGFASMATDTGHNSTVFDVSWALNNPDSIINWAYRAMHGSVVMAKQIVESYYDASKIQYSYYSSCSTGGRQGLKEVQMFPEDFDGVIAGAPAWWISHLSTYSIWIDSGLNLPNASPAHIPEALFPVIVAEILRQCDAQDGVEDGLILNPYTCSFYPEALLCNTQQPTGNQSASCLTPAQLSTIYRIYSDWVDTNQTFVFPALALGADPTDLAGTDATDSPTSFGLSWVQNAVLNDPSWPWQNMDYSIVQLAQSRNPGNTDADDFDLTPFRQRGGKLLSYHGLADQLIPTGSSKYLHSQILQTMSSPNVSSVPVTNNLEDFYRFFLIPGMAHCYGSASPFDSAPTYIGQAGGKPLGATHSVPGFMDAQHDILLALMDWVENGRAPDQLIATKFTNETVELGVQRQIPLCVYPRRVVYRGGDPSKPESFECAGVA